MSLTNAQKAELDKIARELKLTPDLMEPDYKAILNTVQKRDKALSDLGDALVTECGLIQRAPVTLDCVRLGIICRKTDATTALRSYRNFGVWRMCSDGRLVGSIFRGNCTQRLVRLRC